MSWLWLGESILNEMDCLKDLSKNEKILVIRWATDMLSKKSKKQLSKLIKKNPKLLDVMFNLVTVLNND